MMTMLIEPLTKRSMITQCTLIARHNRGKEIEEKKRSIVHSLLTSTLPNHSWNIVNNRKNNAKWEKTDRSKYAKSYKLEEKGSTLSCVLCAINSPVRYIDMTYRLSIYRHLRKISISISISIWSFLKISISIRQFQKYRYRYRYGDFGKYRYRYRYR